MESVFARVHFIGFVILLFYLVFFLYSRKKTELKPRIGIHLSFFYPAWVLMLTWVCQFLVLFFSLYFFFFTDLFFAPAKIWLLVLVICCNFFLFFLAKELLCEILFTKEGIWFRYFDDRWIFRQFAMIRKVHSYNLLLFRVVFVEIEGGRREFFFLSWIHDFLLLEKYLYDRLKWIQKRGLFVDKKV